MNVPADRLSATVHERIFADEIVPDSGLLQRASHEHPRAIILGGQPGAGKGSLTRAAEIELDGDVVKIDPDALRDAYPHIDELRNAKPYDWSSHTQKDAGGWADELRDAAVKEKKNFIFDTTLSNGEWAAGLINDLQKKGYETEVRVVAAHRLESEWGVDNRFSKQLDSSGYGRYVPEGARAAIYDKVPASLDEIHQKTNARIRIFNREGHELYDSLTDPRPPGQVLIDAREARLHDPKVTRGLSEGWKNQVHWHEKLPDAITHNPNIASDTAQRLLADRSKLKVVEGVELNAEIAASHDYAIRIRPNMIKGAGILGGAAVAYDAAHTANKASTMLDQHNTIGAQSTVMHFGGRTVGMLAGAEMGAATGAALGVESGPGALVTGLVGGVVGAVGGETIVNAVEKQRIYTQTDQDHHTWHYQPEHPERGWTRTVLGTADAFQRPGVGVPIPMPQTITADAAVSDQLNYKASGVAVSMALANAPTPKDPYAQPSAPGDTHSVREAPWVRDPMSQQWSRHVTDAVLEHGLTRAHTEVASPQRAAQLEQAAQKTISDNLAHSQRAIAERYHTAYTQYGWQKHGDMPEAVTHVLKTPAHQLLASDGHTYTRDSHGQWQTPGMVYGSNAADSRTRTELNATDRVMTASQSANAAATPKAQSPAPAQAPAQLNHPDHPDHAMFKQAQAHVHALDAAHGRTPDHRSDHLAAAVTVAAKAEGLKRIDAVALSDDGSKAFAVQHTIPRALTHTANVPTVQGLDTSMAQSTQQMAQVNAKLEQHAQQQAQTQQQVQNQQTQQQSFSQGR